MTYGKIWSQDEEDAICEAFKDVPTMETVLRLSDQLNRTPGAILSRLAKPHHLVYTYNDNWFLPAVRIASFREVARHTEAFNQRVSHP